MGGAFAVSQRAGPVTAAGLPTHQHGRHELSWRRESDGTQTLQRTGSRVVLLRVVPDGTYPGMWRVRLPTGHSDMANLSRAKEAAVGVALSILNGKQKAEERGGERPPMRRNELGVPDE